MKQLNKSKPPVVLTVNGNRAVASDQRRLDIAAHADAREGIRQGQEQAKAGKGRDAEEFFTEFEATHGISA